AVAMMSQMSAMGGEEKDQKDPLADMFSEDKAKTKATSLGEGVVFEKSEKIDAGGKKGARVTYKFADINKLKFKPGDAVSDMKPAGVEEANASQKKEEPVTFTYAEGKLVIHLPQPKPGDKPKVEPEPNEEANAQQEAMMKQMFADMKVSVKLMADGGIASTDATHTAGNAITLMEMDFGKVVQTPGALKKLQAAQPESPEDFEKALKGIDGIKVETKPEVTVTLK
ncbi:MAG TPA: hypothetical protein VIM57_02670, partial [Luteolibacter sp.]